MILGHTTETHWSCARCKAKGSDIMPLWALYNHHGQSHGDHVAWTYAKTLFKTRQTLRERKNPISDKTIGGKTKLSAMQQQAF
jgi:hypothetical protein